MSSLIRNTKGEHKYKELKQQVKPSYKRNDISKISPRVKKNVIIKTDDGKETVQKKHLTISIRSLYALF